MGRMTQEERLREMIKISERVDTRLRNLSDHQAESIRIGHRLDALRALMVKYNEEHLVDAALLKILADDKAR